MPLYKIGVLTSSRADYGIYKPLLQALHNHANIDLRILAFGTHLAKAHGYTLSAIEADGFDIDTTIDNMPHGYTAQDIAKNIGTTTSLFAQHFATHQYDLVFCLGDRFEMFAACAASVPYGIKLAHIHGGETTLGAIDEPFRHSITHFSTLHFVAAQPYAARVHQLINSTSGVHNVGALSMDTLRTMSYLSAQQFQEKFSVDMELPTVLITLHPETKNFAEVENQSKEFFNALKALQHYQLLITMPNADTMGNIIRNDISRFLQGHKNALAFENLGSVGYLSAMKHCAFMLGNTSSGFGEASYFPKWVINVGDRQKGRLLTPNIVNCGFEANAIIAAAKNIEQAGAPAHEQIYGNGFTTEKIIEIILYELAKANN